MIIDYNNIEKPLPDILSDGLKVVFIGYNPGLVSANTGHHYAHKSNRFWKFLYQSGLTPYKMSAEEDRKLLEMGYGSTNIVDRPSKAASEIEPHELKSGTQQLYRLMQDIKPQIACFIGIGVYRAYVSSIQGIPANRIDVKTGEQQNRILEHTIDFVCSSTSGLNTISYAEQLRCFEELKKLIDKK